MEPPALPAGPAAPVRAAPGASADLLLPPPTGTKPFTYHWSRAGASLDERFTTSDDAGGVRLTVSAAQTGDSGVYTLQASNEAGSDTSKIRLEVSAEEAPTGEDPPTFLRRLQDLTVKVGSRTRFLVEIISSTECKLTWYRNERRLLEAERVALARDGNFWCADVAAVSVDDAGRWTCTAENAGGRASCSAHLNVLVPKAYKRPEFVEELRALLTEQGTVSLECKVVGVPTPVLRWFKDSREIKAGDVFALTANAEDPTSLGTYTCEAVNCMGRAYSSSKVHVVGRASREGSARPGSGGMTPEPPPIFTKELEDAHVKICEHLTLGCHVVVPPWPRSVVWYNKEGKVEPGERYHTLEDGVGGYLLEMSSAEWADEGEWKCVATSAGGRVGITTCFVTMDVPKNYRKPRFMENLQAVLTEEGLVSFECKVVGFPTPILSWFKDGQELKPGDVYQLTGTNSLGSYCCIAKNCMGQASSSAELTVEDIQNQLNEEEKLQLFSKNQAPKFLQGLKSVEAKIDEPFRFIVKVAIPPEPSVLWYRDDQPVDESTRCHLDKEEKGIFNLDIQNLEFLDQAEWKCVAMNDFGHSVTSCFLKLIIPRHYKKPRFLENLQAILSDEGAVNLECKVIGVPQPVLKWYKDGEELKPGDIHRIISGQDGTCCLGTYTCEAQNCMGIAASSASLLGFDDSMKTKTKPKEEQPLQRNLSLSTIHEERTSQMYDTPVGDITLDDKGEISFSFDGKEVSVSLYETPDLTEEEALQIVEMYADQLSENVTEHNVVELPPLRFVKETSTSGNLLMEAIIIDVSPDYFATPEEDLRTEADVEDLSIADENGLPQLSLDQDIEIGGEDYLEKTMALMSEERSNFTAKSSRRKSDSQRSADDFFSLSRDQSLSEEKRDDDTHVSESELQSFASARSSTKVKSKSSKKPDEEGQESSEPTKTVLIKDEIASKPSNIEQTTQQEQEEVPVIKPKRERRTSRGSRRSSTSSEKSIGKSREELLRLKLDLEQPPSKPSMSDEEFKTTMINISTSLTKVINDVQLIERDIILKSELMSSAATASRSLEIISSLITPLSEIHSIADAAKESVSESREVTSTIFNSIPQPLKTLQQSLTIIEKCIDMESDNKTLVKKTCVAFVEKCGKEVQKILSDITLVTARNYIRSEDKVINEIDSTVSDMITAIRFSAETINARNILSEASEITPEIPTLETKHLKDTQKAIFELKSPLNSLMKIVESAQSSDIIDLPKIKHSEVIMNDMSASIQDLQTALEQIETLSVKETSSTLHKYNTDIIEKVMDSVIKLRGSFEQLSTEPNTEENKTMLKETLSSLKENLVEISEKIETTDKIVGKFDILQSENKLDVLQKMAQILIALENNLPRLEALPTVKSQMVAFHKNLTKVLEKVIESNDAEKYQTMLEICDTVNIINASIRDLDSENILPLASLSNSLKIIQANLIDNIIESELNCSIMNNISDVLVGIQETINKAEDNSLQIDSEYIQDLSSQILNEEKINIIIEHIDQTIASVNTVKIIESTEELKLALTPALENVCPILEELRRSVASVRLSGVEQDERVSEITDASFAQTIATPLCELNQSIIVINQLIAENIGYIKENTEINTAIAEPLHELHTTLEILQQDVISQYGEDLTPYDVSVNMASAVQNLQSCIVMIQEQAGIEGAEDMSTLEDISGIKTSADTLPSDRLVLPTAEETAIEQSYLPLKQEVATTATAQTLQTLNEHILVLQTPDVIEALDTLSEISDYASLKSVIVDLGDLHTGIEGILHPVLIEGSIDFDDTTNITKLAAIAEPMHEIQQSLSVLDTSNIPVFENILDFPSDKINSVFKSISELKGSLEQCMCAVIPAMEIANNTIEISNKVSTLREVCEQLKEIFETSKDAPNETLLPKEVQSLETVVNDLIDATDVSKDIKIEQVKSITEELYLKVMDVQEDIIQFTALSPEQISQEAKLIQIVNDVETNIAVLEQYDFIDLSRASDLTACMSPQLAAEIESESLAHINDIAENAVSVLQDSYQEIPSADHKIVEDFFITCKNEFTILRCLITKATSHKKIIRLLQEFSSLQTLINNFTTKRLELRMSDDVNECLTNYLIHADECLRNARSSLIKVVDSQSDMLIKVPFSQLESLKELKDVLENKTGTEIINVIENILQVAEISKSFENNLHSGIIEELSKPHQTPKPNQEETLLAEKIDELAMIVKAQTETQNLDASSIKVFQELMKCINKHNYKDALGTGKTLIIVKCLANCATIVTEEVTNEKVSIKEATEIKEHENTLKEVLAEMLQPLQALQTELVNIREQVLSGADEDSISIDVTATESIMHTMTELHKDILQQIETDHSTLQNEDIPLLQEVDKEIHTIKDSIKTMDNVQTIQAVKEITKPMEDIEKSLHAVLQAEKDSIEREALSKEESAALINHIDQYIEIFEIIEEITAVIKLEDVTETLETAQELKRSISLNEEIENKETLSSTRAEQTRLAQKLQTSISALQVQVLDSAQELAPTLNRDALKQIVQVTAQLQENLVAVTTLETSAQTPGSSFNESKSIETTNQPSMFSIALESVEVEATEIESPKQTKSDILETSPSAMLVEKIVELEEQSSFYLTSSDPSQEFIDTESIKTFNTEAISDFGVSEAMKELSSMETSAISKTMAVENTTKTKTGVTQKEKILVDKSTAEDILLQHITEYVSEDIIEVIDSLASVTDVEDIQISMNIANELRECIAAIEIDTKKEYAEEIKNPQEQHSQLILSLESALSTLSEQTLEKLQELATADSKPSIEKIVVLIENLKDDLESVKVYRHDVLQYPIQDKHKSDTEVETTQQLTEKVPETKLITEDSIMTVASTSDANVVLFQETTKEKQSESAAPESIMKQSEQNVVTLEATPKELHEETQVKKSLEVEKVNVESLDQEIAKSVQLSQPEVSVKESSPDKLMIQKDASETTAQVVSTEIFDVQEVVIGTELPIQNLSAELATSDLYTGTASSNDEYITDLSIDEVRATDATVTHSVSKLVSPQIEQQPTEALINVAEETFVQTINLLLSDDILHTIFNQQINVEEFGPTAQIARELKQFLITSQNTSDELVNKVRKEFDQIKLYQLQQGLSSIHVQLLENVSETSPSLDHEVQSAANVVLALAELSSEILIESSGLISNVEVQDTQNKPSIKDVYSSDHNEIEISENNIVSSNQCESTKKHKEHSTIQVSDEFENCSSDNNLKQENSAEVNIPVNMEITKPFEEFFDSPTLADEMRSVEFPLAATEVQEVYTLECTKNVETCIETSNSAKIEMNDSLATAVIDVINITDAIETKNNAAYTTEIAELHSTVPLPEVIINQTSFDKDCTNQEFVILENVTVFDDVHPSSEEEIFNKPVNANLKCLSLEHIEPLIDDKVHASSDILTVSTIDKIVTDDDFISTTKLTDFKNNKYFCNSTEAVSSEVEQPSREVAISVKAHIIEAVEIMKDSTYTQEVAAINLEEPLFASAIKRDKVNVRETTLDQNTIAHKSLCQSYDYESDVMLIYAITDSNISTCVEKVNISNENEVQELEKTIKIFSEEETPNLVQQILKETNTMNETDVQSESVDFCVVPTIKTDTVQNIGTSTSTDELLSAEPVISILTVQEDSINTLIDEVLPSQPTEKVEPSNNISKEIINFTVTDEVDRFSNAVVEVEEPICESSSNTSVEVASLKQENVTEEILVFNRNNATDKFRVDNMLEIPSQQRPLKRCNLIEHIDAFITEEVAEIVNEISNITNSGILKESISMAKKLRESAVAADYSATAEETSSLEEKNISKQANLAQTLQDALLTWQTQVLDNTEAIAPLLSHENIQKVSEIISHLQDDLGIAIVFDAAQNIKLGEISEVVKLEELNSITQLETLLQEVNMKINPAKKTIDADESESLRDALDEVQTVIIKLKSEYDGATNDTLNETLEDLECSVRSVQLQINEESPPELLNEACVTLQLLVQNMNAAQQVHDSQILQKLETTENILDKCSKDTEKSVNLLDFASKLDVKDCTNLTSIISNLKTIRDSLKTLRESFLVDADTVIENGVKIVECLNQVEENIFTLEREVETAENISIDSRDTIITAVHSVYGSISNMRGTVSSVQKRFMFENFGRPSESLLHSIKNISVIISSTDDENNKVSWKKISKSLRKVLNHFEDIKFYINLDKTARLPNDAAFTKIILDELKDNISSVLVPRAMVLDSTVIQKVNNTLKCVEIKLANIESESTLQVKSKIPIFKEIAAEMLSITTLIKNDLTSIMNKTKETNLDSKVSSTNEFSSTHQELAVNLEKQHDESELIILEEEIQTNLPLKSVQAFSEGNANIVQEAELVEACVEAQTISEGDLNLESVDSIQFEQKSYENLEISTTLLELNASAQSSAMQGQDQVQEPCEIKKSVKGSEQLTDVIHSEEVAGSLLEDQNQNPEDSILVKNDQDDTIQVQPKIRVEQDVGEQKSEEYKNITDLAFIKETDLAASSSSLPTKRETTDGDKSEDTKTAAIKQEAEGAEQETEKSDVVPGAEQDAHATETEKDSKDDYMQEEARDIYKKQDIEYAEIQQEDEETLAQKQKSAEEKNRQEQDAEKNIKQDSVLKHDEEESCVPKEKANEEKEKLKQDTTEKAEQETKQDAELYKLNKVDHPVEQTTQQDKETLLKQKENEATVLKENAEVEVQREWEFTEKTKQNAELQQEQELQVHMKEMAEAGKEKQKHDSEEKVKQHAVQEQKDKEIRNNKEKAEEEKAKQDAVQEQKDEVQTQKEKAEEENAKHGQDAVEYTKQKAKQDANIEQKEEELRIQYAETVEKTDKQDVLFKQKEEESCVLNENIKEEEEKVNAELDVTKTAEQQTQQESEHKQKEEVFNTIEEEKLDVEKQKQEQSSSKKDQYLELDPKFKEAVGEIEKIFAQKTEEEVLVQNDKTQNEKIKPDEAIEEKVKKDTVLKQEAEEACTLKEKTEAQKVEQERYTTKNDEIYSEQQQNEEAKHVEQDATAKLSQDNEVDQKKEIARIQEVNTAVEKTSQEKDATEDAKIKLKEENDNKALKEKADAIKQKEEAKKIIEEEDAELKHQKEETQFKKEELKKPKKEAEITQKEVETLALLEQSEIELKQKEEENCVLKEKTDGEKSKQEQDTAEIQDAEIILKGENDACAPNEHADADSKQKEEGSRVLKENKDAELNQQKKEKQIKAKTVDKAKIEADIKEKEEEALKKNADAELKQREEACVQKEQAEADILRQKLEQDTAEKAKNDAELKQKEEKARVQKEEEARKVKEREVSDLKQQEEEALIKKEEVQKSKQEAETKQKEEEARALKEKADAELEQKKKALVRKEQVEADKLRLEQDTAEKAKKDAELKQKEKDARIQKEEEARALKEKEDADLKQQEEKAQIKKNEVQKEEIKQKEKEEARILKEKADAKLKQKKEARTQKEQAEADILRQEMETAENSKNDAELKQKEEEARIQKEEEARALKEKEDADLKQQKENARIKKEEQKATKEAEINQKEEARIEKEKANADILRHEIEAAEKAKNDAELKQKEQEARIKKEEEARALKENDDADLKQQKENARIKKEEQKATKEAEIKQKEEARIAKEKANADILRQEMEAAEKAKNDAELKQKEEEARIQKVEEARALKDNDDADLKQQEENARIKKEEQKVQKEAEIKQKEEEARTLKEKADAELKQKEKARAQKEKAQADILRQEMEAAEKAKNDAELKQKEEEARIRKEEEARALKEKEDADLKQQEENARIKKEEQKAKKEAEIKQKEEEACTRKEKADAELKQKEEARAQKEKAQADILRQEVEAAEKAKNDAELKQKEEEARIQKEEETRALKEKEDADLKQQEENARIKKEKVQKAKQEAAIKQKEEEARAFKEKTDADNKQKEEDAHAQKEQAEADKLKHEQFAAETAKKNAEMKEKEEVARIQKEEEARAQKKQETLGQEQNAAEEAMKDAELKQKEEDARVQKEKKARALKEKEDADLKHEEDARIKKEKVKKAKKEAAIKQKEEEARTLKEKADAELKQKEEARAQKEQAKADILRQELEAAEKVKKDAELKQKEEEARIQKEEEARALKEKEDADLKQREEEALNKKEEVQKSKQEAETKQKEEEARALKEKTDAELQEREKALAQKEQAEADKLRLEQDTAEKAKKDAELKQKEENARIQKEKESQVLKEKGDAELKEKEEARALKEQETEKLKRKEANDALAIEEKADADIKQNVEEARMLKEKVKKAKIGKAKKEANVKQKVEEAHAQMQKAEVESLKQEQDAAETALQKTKEGGEIKRQKENDAQGKEDADFRQKEKEEGNKKEALRKNKDAKKVEIFDEKILKDREEQKVVNTRAEKKKIMGQDDKEIVKRSHTDETSMKSTKYTERLSKSERRDDELHIYKEDRQTKKENGDITSKSRLEESDEHHYIKEYQYEPSRSSHKLEAREKPRFVDHNHRDYTMEFARPSGYRERSFDVDKSDSLTSHNYLGGNATIFKAQTLILDSQLRSSTPLLLDTKTCRTSEPPERKSEARPRSKAHSEARTITSEKRTGASRDSKRKPVFSTFLTDRTAVEGSRVKLTCSVLSSSDPTVIWYKNGVLLDNKLKYRTKFIDGLITLELLNAVPSDSAEYSCTIQNENGSISSSANLKVYPSFEASPIPPTFTRSIRDTYHLAENELVLECRIRGQPLPTITWLKDDKSVSNNSRYQAYYLADGVCRLAIEHPTTEDSGKYTCKAENSVWSDQITHVVNFTGKESRQGPNIATVEKSRFNRQLTESRRPHFTNVLSDYKVVTGGTIGLQVEIRGAPTRVEWLREGCSVTEVYRNAKTFVEQGLYTLALSDVTEKESGMYTCRAWSSQCHVDMNAAITVVQPNELDGKPAIIVGRPEKDILISIGEDVNVSFRVQGEPKPKVVFMKGIRDITTSQRVCKMTSDDYVKFTLKRSVVSDAGTYCILARNAYGVDRAFVTVVVRQRASSDNLISDWTYPVDDSNLSIAERKYKSVPERIPGEPCVAEGGNNWISLGWPKSEPGQSAPVLAYKVESWLLGKDGGARWSELGITPLTSFDAFNLKQGEEYHFRVTPRNRYGWGESVQTSCPISVGLAGDRPEFTESLPGQLKVLVGETANLTCSVKGTPAPEVVWMKNGHEIEDEDRRLSSSFNGCNCSLTIKDINIEDEARYSCEATNLHGRASTYARLAVVTDRSIWEADAKLKRERSADVDGDYPPQFTMRLRDRRVQATYPVRLTCQVIGSPEPRITWFKDGLEVRLDNRRSHFQDEHFHTLEIAPTNLEDGGVYEAMARNSSGAVCCRCNLVVDKGIRAYVAPEFCCGLEPLYRLTDGEELRISAVVEAYPSVGVTWFRDGVRLRPSRRAIMTLDRDGQIELALAAVTSRDAGVYSCTASNEVGRASTSGKVEVIGSNVLRTPPVFISHDEPYSKEPMFIRKPRSSEAREGDTVIIACEVVGDPKPDVYWLRDFLKPDYYRDSSHFKRMGDGPEYRFEIPHAKLDYTGAYSVVARNTHGEAKAIISLQILAKDPSSSDEHNIRYGRVEVLPRFSKELTDLLSCDGDAVEFECHLTGNPEPSVRWFHYQELIRDCSDFETSFEDGAARLKIKQVTAEDEGTYTCEAANNLGKATSSACLVVYPPGEPNTLSQRLRRPPAFLSAASTPRSTPRSTPARSVSRTPGPETRRLCSPARTLAPSFYTYPFNKVAEEGDTVTLQCAIKGNPAPWATWDKDGVIITPSSRITIKEKDDVLRLLEIEQVTVDDVGVYRITIENEFGRQEASARIEVITQKGKFYAGVRAVSPSPRKTLTYRNRRPSTPRQD